MTNSSVDQAAIVTRLGRVKIFGKPARDLGLTLDPELVREISDENLAELTGGIYTPPGMSDGHLHPADHLYPS